MLTYKITEINPNNFNGFNIKEKNFDYFLKAYSSDSYLLEQGVYTILPKVENNIEYTTR